MECLKKKPEYVVTHSGAPHGDDMFTGAIYKFFFGDIKIIRKPQPTERELDNQNIHVFDIGGKLNVLKNNYDHHSSEQLPASCILVWRALMPEYTEELRKVKVLVSEHLLKKVSDADKGDFSGDTDGSFLGNHTKYFGSSDEAFEAGVEFCYRVLLGKVSHILKTDKLSARWKKFKTFGNGVVTLVDETADFVEEDFKSKAIELGVKYLILKKHNREQLPMLYSLNGMVPLDRKRQRELSNDGRSAVYFNVDGAINHALEMSLKHAK